MKSKHITIIAEAGVNHNGSMKTAKKLIDVAALAGADFVKFQTFRAKKLVSKNSEKAEYQINNTSADESQYDMINKLELSKDNHLELIEHCKNLNIKFLSTPFDIESVDLLVDLGIPLIKIPSGEITNMPFLRYVSTQKKPLILSTGMSTLEEIDSALNILLKNGIEKNDITILHCNTEYPTPIEDVNIKAMNTIKSTFDINIGYSDHTLGIDVSIAAAALGATIIEKHFTLDRSMNGPDHNASLEPNELIEMVKSIRRIEKALGDGNKVPSKSEMKNINIARKSIVAKIVIKKGEIFSEKNISTKRPAGGISPMNWDQVLGKKSRFNFDVDEIIKL